MNIIFWIGFAILSAMIAAMCFNTIVSAYRWLVGGTVQADLTYMWKYQKQELMLVALWLGLGLICIGAIASVPPTVYEPTLDEIAMEDFTKAKSAFEAAQLTGDKAAMESAESTMRIAKLGMDMAQQSVAIDDMRWNGYIPETHVVEVVHAN